MKLSKLLKALAASKTAVEALRESGVKIPKKLDASLATADLVASTLKEVKGSSSSKPSNDGAR